MPLSSVLMFGWEYPPHNSGGLGVACQGMCEALVNDGHKVTFVLPKFIEIKEGIVPLVFADSASHKHIDEWGLSIIRQIQNPYTSPDEYKKLLKIYYNYFGEDAPYPDSLIERVDLYSAKAYGLSKDYKNVDIIHAHDWLSFGAGIAAKRATGKPLVVHIHATEYDRSPGGSINTEIYKREKAGLEVADKIIAVSEFTKNTITKHYGITPDKILVVHNGVVSKISTKKLSDDLLTIKESGNAIVLSLGRITLQKGIDYFMHMARIVLDHMPKTFFVVAGSGDMERQIIELGAELGISHNVLFTGFVRGDTIDSLYRTADVFIMPSVSEPFGIAPLEAMDQGTPVIISKQSGVSEVASHTLKVDFWDVEDMANKVIAILAYPALKNTLSTEGGKQVKTLNWGTAAKKLASIYNELKK